MRIRHPISFVLMIVIWVTAATLITVWSGIHILVALALFGMIGLLRFAAHHEGRHDLKPGLRWFRR
jgi:hypothetical protein